MGESYGLSALFRGEICRAHAVVFSSCNLFLSQYDDNSFENWPPQSTHMLPSFY